MLRAIFALISGLFAAMIVITGLELVSAKWLFPVPAGVDLGSVAAINAYVATMPVAAHAWILGGWLLGAFVGGGVASALAERGKWLPAALIGALIMAATIANAMRIQHPAWMLALAVSLPVPMALLAGWLLRKVWPAPGK